MIAWREGLADVALAQRMDSLTELVAPHRTMMTGESR